MDKYIGEIPKGLFKYRLIFEIDEKPLDTTEALDYLQRNGFSRQEAMQYLVELKKK